MFLEVDLKCTVHDDHIQTFALADSGNRATTLLSSELFSKLCPDGNLTPVLSTLSTAGPANLKILGKVSAPLTMTFKHPTFCLTYDISPWIIEGLQLPMILSARDLKALKANIDLHQDRVKIPIGDDQSIFLPLTHYPNLTLQVCPFETVTLQPHREHIIKCVVPYANPQVDVLVEPLGSVEDLDSCYTVDSSLDTVRNDKSVFLRVSNYSDFPVKLKAGKPIAQCIVAAAQVDLLSEVDSLMTATDGPLTDSAIKKRLIDELNFAGKDCNMTPAEKERCLRIFIANKEALVLGPYDLGSVSRDIVECDINTGDAKPIRSKCRPVPPNLRKPLEEQLNLWLQKGIIEPSDSAWASPLVLVKKKSGSMRICVDFRLINSVIKADSRPIPSVEDKLASLGSGPKPCRVMGTLDLADAYTAVHIKANDVDKSAIITPFGLYHFKRMPQGLRQSPGLYAILTQKLEANLKAKYPQFAGGFLFYFDDALFWSDTTENLLTMLEALLKELVSLGLKIQAKKCRIGLTEIAWLGHVISEKGIKPDPGLTSTITNWKSPENLREIRALHGLINYFRKFLRLFAARTVNIRGLLQQHSTDGKKNASKIPVRWTPQCQAELKDIIISLTSAPILGHAKFHDKAGPFCLTVDTSKHGTGSTLSQLPDDFLDTNDIDNLDPKKVISAMNSETIVAYASRKLTPGERCYSSYKLEIVGATTACEHWRYYLLGKPFILRTDSKALAWILKTKSKMLPPVAFRWQAILSTYDFRIFHIPGSLLGHCDGISRKGYATGDFGNMVLPCRMTLWYDDFDKDEARQSMDDNFWTKVMKKKFSRQPDNEMVAVMTRRQAQQLVDADPVEVDDNHEDDDEDLDEEDDAANRDAANLDNDNDDSLPAALEPFEEDEFQDQLSRGLPILESKDLHITIDKGSLLKCQFHRRLKIDQASCAATAKCMAHLCNHEPWPVDKAAATKACEAFDSPDADLYLSLFAHRKNLKLRDDIIYITRDVQQLQRECLVIPDSLVDQILHLFHLSEGLRHLGIAKTVLAISQLCWFPKMSEKVTDFILSCRTCRDGKKFGPENTPGLGIVSAKPLPRLTHWSVDIMSMPPGVGGLACIFLLVDLATGFVECFPLRKANSSQITTVLQHQLIPRYGLGLTILCDKATYFTSTLMRTVVSNLESRIYFGTAYHSCSHPIERYIKTFGSLLRTEMIHENAHREKWPHYIPHALLAIRSMPDETGFSSYYRTFGKFPLTRSGQLLSSDPNDNILSRLEASRLSATEPTVTVVNDPVCLKEDSQSVTYAWQHSGQASEFHNNWFLQRTLQKIPDKKGGHVLAEFVNSLSANECEVNAEAAQGAHDTMTLRRHNYNATQNDKKKRRFIPVVSEIVDWFCKQADTSEDNRRFQQLWRGPLQIIGINSWPNTVMAQFFNLQNMEPYGRIRQVPACDLRPTLYFASNARQNWKPPWS